MKITTPIKESAIKWLLSAIFGILGLLVGSIYSDLIPIILPRISQELPKVTLLKFLTLAIILVVLSWVLSYIIYIYSKTKLIPKFGVVWDKNKEPYCPNCEKPLAKHPAKFEGNVITGVDCVKCKKSFILMTDDGRRITLIEAQKLL